MKKQATKTAKKKPTAKQKAKAIASARAIATEIATGPIDDPCVTLRQLREAIDQTLQDLGCNTIVV